MWPTDAGERLRTGVNETKTEPRALRPAGACADRRGRLPASLGNELALLAASVAAGYQFWPAAIVAAATSWMNRLAKLSGLARWPGAAGVGPQARSQLIGQRVAEFFEGG
jgi:hypothetical protein